MSHFKIQVEETFPNLSFIDGTMIVGLSNEVLPGIPQEIILKLTLPDGTLVQGPVTGVHIHFNDDDPPNRVRIGVGGELGDQIKPGHVLRVIYPPIAAAPSEELS